jgi:predicted nucleic acid-binding protein
VALASCLLDTNILLRISRRTDPEYATAHAAVAKLAEAGTTLVYTPEHC